MTKLDAEFQGNPAAGADNTPQADRVRLRILRGAPDGGRKTKQRRADEYHRGLVPQSMSRSALCRCELGRGSGTGNERKRTQVPPHDVCPHALSWTSSAMPRRFEGKMATVFTYFFF